MKVTLVAPFATAPKGTTFARVLPMARALAASGHECVVLIPPYDNRCEWREPETTDGVRLEWLAPTRHRLPQLQTIHDQFAMYREAVDRVEMLDPDIVHAFKPKAVSGFVQLNLWFNRIRGAVVLDCDDWEGRQGWSDLERYPAVLNWMFDFQERVSLGRNDGVTVASLELQRRLARFEKPLSRIPNFFDSDRYSGWGSDELRDRGRSNLGAGDDPVGVLYTRFFEYHEMGFAALIQRFLERLPLARLIVIGASKNDDHTEVQRLTAVAGLSKRVRFCGWPGWETVGEFLAAADVAIMPSVDTVATRAKCPARLLDLLVAGVPVAAHDVGEARTYVIDGENGRLVAAHESTGLADAAVDLVEGDSRGKARAASRRLLAGELSSVSACRKLETLYELALDARAAR